MGSNLKKGLYMRFKASKKKFVLLVSLFVLFVISLIGGVYLLFNGEKLGFKIGGIDKYEELMQYCEVEEKGLITKVSCRAFLVREKILADKDITCFSLLVYDGFDGLKEMDICENSSFFEWENPYKNYKKYVPVDLEIEMGKGILANYKAKKVKFTLMEDQDLFKVFSQLSLEFDPEKNMRNLTYIKENQEIIDSGYYLTGLSESGILDRFVFYNASIRDLFVKENKVVLVVETSIYGNDLIIKIESKEFLYNYNVILGGELESMEIVVNTDNINSLNKEGNHQILLRFNPENFKVEEYLQSLQNISDEYILLTEELELISVIKKWEGYEIN